MEASSNKGGLAPIDIKKLVNQIFARRGAPDVKNFAKEFADGSKSGRNESFSLRLNAKVWHFSIVRFQELFNILYDERIDCKLIRSNLLEDRMLNWNRINGKSKREHTERLKSFLLQFKFSRSNTLPI